VTSFEGCVLKAYPDPASGSDPWTVGIGHTGPDVHPSTVWTKDQAVSALVKDLTRTGVGVTSLIDGHPTSQSQFDALVSFAFNLGLGALGRSTLLKLHKAGDYAGAQKQFRYWNKAAGKVMTGLTRRRAAEADLYGARP
jgi:GH24 family phage-related lysozyme (muramidase)